MKLISKMCIRDRSHSDGQSYSVDGMLMVNRRLNSKGRNLTLRMRGGYSDSDNKSFNISDVNYFLQRKPGGGYDRSYMHQYNVCLLYTSRCV